MAIRQVITEGDEVLGKVCKPVDKFNERLSILIDDMLETMYATNGVGLAAPQVGLLRRVVVIDVGEGPIELVNPKIVAKKGKQECVEGCLSVPGIYGYTKRPEWVKVEGFNRKGEKVEYEGDDLLARAFCHELDHLEGILFREKVTEYVDAKDLQQMEENDE